MMTFLLIILALTQVGQQSEGLVFGLNTFGASIDKIQDFTPQEEGGVTFFKEECYMSALYDGLYLWSSHDQRMNNLASILEPGGVLHLVHVYTPRWVSGWYSNETTIPQGEINNRPVGWPEYDEHIDWYAENFEALIRRYGPGGIVPLLGGYSIRSWGLWTEPDGGSLMMGFQEFQDNSASYLGFQAYHDIASLAAERIKSLDPGCEVIAGGFLSPCSGREPDQYNLWQIHAEKCIQLCFSGEYNPSSPVEFKWNVPPDALDWHPYDYMILDDYVFPLEEWYYDPLVLDNPVNETSDFMYRDRPDELPVHLDEWFNGILEPDWNSMPQKLLEFCPTYSLLLWRNERRLPTPEEFYTKWRANYFITSLLLLSESQHMHTLGPCFSVVGWWVEQYAPFISYSNIVSEQYPNVCDLAYLYISSQLAGYYCMNSEVLTPDLRSSMNRVYSVKVTHWTFEDATHTGPSIHALRTSREMPYESYDPEIVYSVQFRVKPFVTSVDLFDIAGRPLGTYIPGPGTVTVPVDGYVRYAVENYCNSDVSSTDPATIVVLCNREESMVEFIPSGITRLNIYDLSGRMVEEMGTRETGMGYPGTFIWNYGDGNIPAGCYFVAGFNGTDGPLVLEKVVIW